ncbi:MAG TPA: FAD-linked oxidase C-terminal domain-containing protein [Pantanalinema sp.]
MRQSRTSRKTDPRIAFFREGGQAAALEAALAQRIKGEVRFDDGSRALYATDASNYRQVPIGVVIPRDAEDVVATLETCRRFGAPVLGRGGGTSLAGQGCNVAVVLDFSKVMHRLLWLDPEARLASVEPGIVLDRLREAAEAHGLTFGPDPATHTHCTLGGMIGNNSCGVHSVMAGRTSDNVETLGILTYDGHRMRVGRTDEAELERILEAGGAQAERYRKLLSLRDRYAPLIRARFPKIPRRVSGYALDELLPENGFNVARALVGSESTCVMVLDATVRLVPSPPARSLLVLGYPSVFEAGDHVLEVLSADPIGLEGMDDRLVNDMTVKGLHPRDLKLLPDGRGWLLAEFGGETKAESDARARALMRKLAKLAHPPTMKLFDDPTQEAIVWRVRESGLGATAFVPGKPLTWEGWEDSAVAPEKLGAYLRALRELLETYDYGCDLYGHFGQGCVHTRIDFDLETAAGIEKFRSFVSDASDLVVSFGGSISGEHGDGQSKAEFLGKMYGPELLEAFEEFKAIWDPEGKLNPGKIVDPYRVDQNLRLGTGYRPPQPKTHFKFPQDQGSFSRATLRCVGVGECRKEKMGTMCPSYMVTREEKHATRGRARLLFELFQQDVLKGGWREPSVKEALDLCLACKGCKGECPVNVDMATYKAEFLSHYYEGRLRPRAAYAFGQIQRWAELASRVPWLANLATQTPLLREVAKAIAGVAPARAIPAFAPTTFKQWFSEREAKRTNAPPVVLWADTFSNHFQPEVAMAAVEVLEDAGFRVVLPGGKLCCGRPLYDYGFLDQAETQLATILRALRPALRRGTPIVGLEPSCVAVFRDELGNLFPDDEDAKRLKEQVFLLGEFLVSQGYSPPALGGRAIVQGHCHQKAIMGMDGDATLLKRLGLDFEILDSGCCGMAGAFGFEEQHHEVAMQVGERVLLPAVREADAETLVIADGFSCREQIRQSTPRKALHLAQVLSLAIRQGAPRGAPEPARDAPRRRALLGAAGIVLLGGALAFAWRRRGR